MTISVAEEASTSSADNNKACSNGKSWANECSSSKRTRIEDGDF